VKIIGKVKIKNTMKKMSYKKGGAKKKKKYTNGGPTPSGISNFYGKVDSFLDAALPGRQKRQDMRTERKDLRQDVRQEKALKRIESGRKMKAGGTVMKGKRLRNPKGSRRTL